MRAWMQGAPIGPSTTVRFTSPLLAVGFAILLGIVALTYRVAEQSRASFDEVIAARDIRTVAVDLRNAIVAAESSQRGFIFNGNEIYLAPYETAKSLATRRFGRLQLLLTNDKSSTVVLERLKSILDEKFREMDRTIALKRGRDDAGVAEVFNTNRGKTLMDEANVFLNGLTLAADDRLTSSVTEQTENFAWLKTATIVGGVMIVAVVGFAIASIFQYTRALRTAQRELQVLNVNLEERVRERTEELVQANEEVQRFAYIVTHDLRAPLVNIMGFTSEVEAGVASLQALIQNSGIGSDSDDPLVVNAKVAATEDLPEAIGFIRSSTKKMDGLINTILRLSREGRRPLHPEHFSLADAIATCTSALQHQIKDVGGEISLDLRMQDIETDRIALEQVLSNIFDNAIKYRSAKRPLRIKIATRPIGPERVAIDVTDNGRGISQEDLERVFELFRRAGIQDQPGEGIGLASVRTIVRRLGGDIRVRSTIDASTTFTVELPRVPTFAEKVAA